MNNTYFLFLSRLLHTPVIESQVINWIEVLKSKNIKFDLIIDNPVSDFFRKGKMKKTFNVIKNYENRIQGKIYYTYAVRRPFFFDFISSIIKAVFITIIVKIKLRKYKKENVLIQTRHTSDDITLKIVKFFIKRVVIVCDIRGDATLEYINKLGYDNIGDINESYIKKEYFKLKKNQLKMCLLADKIFCVSDVLKNKLIKDFDNQFKDKIVVFPGGADSNLFFFNKETRSNYRKKLNIENNIVVIYCGRLLHHWHKKDLIFKSISSLQRMNLNLFFICLTPDVKIGNRLVKKYDLPSQRILVKMIENFEINNYLNASDFGIVLRDNIGTNRVASPTKIAEYLLSGLPVLLSNCIGDYSNYIKNNKSGQVIDSQTIKLVDEVNIDKLITLDRRKISKKALNLFAKQNLADKVKKIYCDILKYK